MYMDVFPHRCQDMVVSSKNKRLAPGPLFDQCPGTAYYRYTDYINDKKVNPDLFMCDRISIIAVLTDIMRRRQIGDLMSKQVFKSYRKGGANDLTPLGAAYMKIYKRNIAGADSRIKTSLGWFLINHNVEACHPQYHKTCRRAKDRWAHANDVYSLLADMQDDSVTMASIFETLNNISNNQFTMDVSRTINK